MQIAMMPLDGRPQRSLFLASYSILDGFILELNFRKLSCRQAETRLVGLRPMRTSPKVGTLYNRVMFLQ